MMQQRTERPNIVPQSEDKSGRRPMVSTGKYSVKWSVYGVCITREYVSHEYSATSL